MTTVSNMTTTEKQEILLDAIDAQSEALRLMADHFRGGLVMDQVGEGDPPQASLTMSMEDWNLFLSMLDSAVDRFNEFGEFFGRLET